MTKKRARLVYVTSNRYKKEESEIIADYCKLRDGTPVGDKFKFEVWGVPILETLEVDLRTMVRAEVINAYSQLKVPCFVEHAGLIFDEFRESSYPGGLTKPMWNALGDKFIQETNSGGRRVVARAVVAYCDGKDVRTFVGETPGVIADAPRGSRAFYWDTVFQPSEPSASGKTYAEIVDDPKLGLKYKVTALSQSAKAILNLLDYLVNEPPSTFWAHS